jgi:hypothetical protein
MYSLQKKLEKILLYIELYRESQERENNIKRSVFYLTFGRYNQQEEELAQQKKVTEKIKNRIENLKKEL